MTTSPRTALDFGGTATKLSRTPLGIIALFIVLVYAMATFVLVGGRFPPGAPIAPLVWFMVGFPVLVFSGFVWLVANKPLNLYGPGDFGDSKDYLALAGLTNVPAQERMPEAPALPEEEEVAIKKALPETASEEAARPAAKAGAVLLRGPESPVVEDVDVSTKQGRIAHRKALSDKTRKLFLVHVLTRSTKPNQKYDVGLYVKHHEDKDLGDVESAEFFLGRSWGNRIIAGKPSENRIGISTSAYGPFLCTCLVTFTDGEQVMLYRYVDFDMGPVVDGAR